MGVKTKQFGARQPETQTFSDCILPYFIFNVSHRWCDRTLNLPTEAGNEQGKETGEHRWMEEQTTSLKLEPKLTTTKIHLSKLFSLLKLLWYISAGFSKIN